MQIYEEIEKNGPHPNGDSRQETERRRHFARHYAWGCPTREAIQCIKDFVGEEKILEIGAGNGLWAMLLQDIGVCITPTDKAPGQTMNHKLEMAETPTFVNVYKIDHQEAVQQFGKDHSILMLCWPPFEKPMAKESLMAFAGNKVIFVGEEGCTGCPEFHHLLAVHWSLVKTIDIPKWELRNDNVYLYVRDHGK